MKSMLVLNYTLKLRNISWMFFSDVFFRDQSCSANTLEQVSKQFEISLAGWLCKDLRCYSLIVLVEAARNNFVVLGETWHQITKASEIISCAKPDLQIWASSTWLSLLKNWAFRLRSGERFWSWTPSSLHLQCVGSHHRTILKNTCWIPFRWFQETVKCAPTSNGHSVHTIILDLVLRSSVRVVLFLQICPYWPSVPTNVNISYIAFASLVVSSVVSLCVRCT